MPTFEELGLSAPVLAALVQMGYEEPSPVQMEAIPVLLAGRDAIVQALTGTGKTAAFGIPIVERVDPARPETQALVLAPTRELAIQVTSEITRIGRQRGLAVVPIYGGQSYEPQFRALRRGAQVIVATPGRLIDHLERGTANLDHVGLLVLDEADEMLQMGFMQEVAAIVQRAPKERQTALFSATMPEPIVALSRDQMCDPVRITLSRPRELTVPLIDQYYYQVPRPYKIEALARLLDQKDPDLALVFCATKRMVDDLAEALVGRGHRAEPLHGDMSQALRERVITGAREGRFDVLVATDVAARGLDLPEVTHVVNFDLPNDAESYVHRIGRTGRAGRAGEALTLVAPWEVREIKALERATGAKIKRAEVPTVAQVEARERSQLVERLEHCLERGNWGLYRELVETLAEAHDPVDVAAAALSLAAGPAKERTEIPAPPPPRDDYPHRRAQVPAQGGRGYRPPPPWAAPQRGRPPSRRDGHYVERLRYADRPRGPDGQRGDRRAHGDGPDRPYRSAGRRDLEPRR